MEVLEIAGYTEEEKLKIATDHLVDKQVKNHGLTAEYIRFTPDALRQVIRGYTREAGVRNLEREIGALCRKVARRRAEGDEAPIEVTPDVVVEMLGAPRFLDEEMEERTKDPGVAIGLAWTPAGGEVLFIEASRMAGTGSLTLTGQLGDVMKESARAALSWLRTHARGVRHRSGFLQERRDARPRAVGRHPEGRPVGGRDDGDGDGLRADRTPRTRRYRDDGRDHPVGPRAADRRHQGEGARGAARGHPARSFCPGRTRRTSTRI